jgi:hypothetical protein
MTPWLDFSGAPPLLIPKRLVARWHGATDPATGRHFDLNTKAPVTDYDRACAAAWPGRGALRVGDSFALALYTEFDEHTWDAGRRMIAGGSWLPTDNELAGAAWSNPFSWRIADTEFVLMNSAANGSRGLRPEEFMELRLASGNYIVEYADLEATRVGCFHRFNLAAEAPSERPGG